MESAPSREYQPRGHGVSYDRSQSRTDRQGKRTPHVSSNALFSSGDSSVKLCRLLQSTYSAGAQPHPNHRLPNADVAHASADNPKRRCTLSTTVDRCFPPPVQSSTRSAANANNLNYLPSSPNRTHGRVVALTWLTKGTPANRTPARQQRLMRQHAPPVDLMPAASYSYSNAAFSSAVQPAASIESKTHQSLQPVFFCTTSCTSTPACNNGLAFHINTHARQLRAPWT